MGSIRFRKKDTLVIRQIERNQAQLFFFNGTLAYTLTRRTSYDLSLKPHFFTSIGVKSTPFDTMLQRITRDLWRRSVFHHARFSSSLASTLQHQLNEFEQQGTYKSERVITSPQSALVTVDTKDTVSLIYEDLFRFISLRLSL